MPGAVDSSLIKQPIMSPLLAANILPEIEVSACFRLAISLNLFFVLACFFANFFLSLLLTAWHHYSPCLRKNTHLLSVRDIVNEISTLEKMSLNRMSPVPSCHAGLRKCCLTTRQTVSELIWSRPNGFANVSQIPISLLPTRCQCNGTEL